jgi:hypothetical protein
MKKISREDMRREYRREEPGKGVRAKYLARYKKGTNLVLLDDKVAKAFPTADAVNEALLGLLALTEKTTRMVARAGSRSTKRRAA